MRKRDYALLLVTALLLTVVLSGCLIDTAKPASSSQVKKATVAVSTDADGRTVEQKNVANRMLADNKPGSVKHLYVISSYSGQVLIYSTVAGKVTSSAKRLTPSMANYSSDGGGGSAGFRFDRGGGTFYTSEVLGDDGTYGSSSEYLYWWDTKGVYHQHYVSGGQILHISDQPLAVKSVTINMNLAGEAQ